MLEKAMLGGGCYWCLEAVFQRIEGVVSVVSGFAGGATENPTYPEVCAGGTGHAEVVQVEYDSEVISYREILEIFFEIHDPTTLNRQGNDVGAQYRSIILYVDERQKQLTEQVMAVVAGKYDVPLVTELRAFKKFYPASDEHQDYFNRNSDAAYCRLIIEPKLKKYFKKH